ncbi:MAG: hypothetical protein RR704_04025 [Stenotrophomonas sp.]|jgi:ribosomal protein S27AE
MLFMIGQGERTVVVGPVEHLHCPRCAAVTAFEPQLTYKYATFDLLFGMVYAKRYQLACPGCGHGWVLDTRATERSLGGVPIPFRLRYGMAIGLAVAVAIAVAAWHFNRGS